MKRIAFFTILAVILISFHFVGILSPFEKAIFRLATPVSSIFQGVFSYISKNYEDYLTKEELEEENKRLRDRIKELVVERAEVNILQEENTSLKKILAFLEEKKYDAVVARVMGKTVEGDTNTIVINRGKDDGVEIDSPVVAESGILIGRVVKVNKSNSIILLLSDGNSQVAGMVQNNNKTTGIIRGGYGLGIRMELIPQTEEIENDEIIITSGLELEIPKGLLVGTVESIVREENTPFQTIIIKPLINYDKLDVVSVIKVN